MWSKSSFNGNTNQEKITSITKNGQTQERDQYKSFVIDDYGAQQHSHERMQDKHFEEADFCEINSEVENCQKHRKTWQITTPAEHSDYTIQ